MFDVKDLRALGLPWKDDCGPGVVVSHRLVDHTRWSLVYEIVFKYEARLYRTTYRVGATEMQEEGPWEWSDKVEAEEVEAYQELVTVYRPVV
jgi:hypothetical protein